MKLQLALKEWAAVIDALGRGRQAIIIRSYAPTMSEFLLYPTFSFYEICRGKQELFNEKFQKSHQQQAWTSGANVTQRAKQDFLVDVDYWAKVEACSIAEKSQPWEKSQDLFIWSPQHVREYARTARDERLFVWLVRVFKLDQRLLIGRVAQGGPPNIYRHPVQVDTAGSKAVLDDERFSDVKAHFLSLFSNELVGSRA